jgi:hypothetical protein
MFFCKQTLSGLRTAAAGMGRGPSFHPVSPANSTSALAAAESNCGRRLSLRPNEEKYTEEQVSCHIFMVAISERTYGVTITPVLNSGIP